MFVYFSAVYLYLLPADFKIFHGKLINLDVSSFALHITAWKIYVNLLFYQLCANHDTLLLDRQISVRVYKGDAFDLNMPVTNFQVCDSGCSFMMNGISI